MVGITCACLFEGAVNSESGNFFILPSFVCVSPVFAMHDYHTILYAFEEIHQTLIGLPVDSPNFVVYGILIN